MPVGQLVNLNHLNFFLRLAWFPTIFYVTMVKAYMSLYNWPYQILDKDMYINKTEFGHSWGSNAIYYTWIFICY